jgi:NAD(P)-dependent dehydrogenase (short-subunit alcohol dehydrogenase family)
VSAQAVPQELAGRIAIVTGAGSGIGRASARALAARAATVVAVDRAGDAAQATAAELATPGRALEADIADESAVARVIEATVAEFGGVDLLHANAAVQWFGTVLDCTPDQWDQTFAVNLRGVFLMARACLPEMVRRGGGVIVATSSDCAIRTCAQAAAYVSSKAGLIGLVRSIAVDFGPENIRANLVTPGVTDTPGLRRLYSEGDRTPEEGMGRAASLSPLGRVGLPEDLADAVAFLCSERARFITGANLMVDGGMTVTYGAD